MFFRTRCEDEVLSAPSEKREERERMEKLLSKYKSSLLDQHSLRAASLPHLIPSPSISGLRRNNTNGRLMSRKVRCPVAPVLTGSVHVDTGSSKPLMFDQMPPARSVGPNQRLSSISTSTCGSDRSEESEMVDRWLSSIHFEEYSSNFLDAGYDLPTISRMTPEDLIAIGITNPLHRKKIKHEISSLSVPDGIPVSLPDSLFEWLYLLRLEEYEDGLRSQGYDTISRVGELTWEDFEEIGIRKLGHQKRLALAIKKYNAVVKGQDASHLSPSLYSSSSSGISSYSTASSVTGSFPDLSRLPAAQQSSFRPVVLTTPLPENEAEHFSSLQRVSHKATAGSKQKPVAMIAASRPASSASSGPSFYEFMQDLKAKTGLGPNDLMSTASTCSLHSNSSFVSEVDSSQCYASGQMYAGVGSESCSSLYGTLRRNKKPPPPPPKRTNSVMTCPPTSLSSAGAFPVVNSSAPVAAAASTSSTSSAFTLDMMPHTSRDHSFFDAMQEQAFATCVKSLTSRFSQIASLDDGDEAEADYVNGMRQDVTEFPPPPPPLRSSPHDPLSQGSSEFPPPPTPLYQSAEDLQQQTACSHGMHNFQSQQSLSSSSESLPFAQDNIGTMRQSAACPHFTNQRSNSSSGQETATTSVIQNMKLQNIDALAASLLSSSSPPVLRRKANNYSSGSSYVAKGTVIDDIESMLSNLSNQLDAMLEQEIGQQQTA